MIDLKSAFDLVEPETLIDILLTKAEERGTQAEELNDIKWLHSFLTDRKFRVKVENESTDEASLPIGMP